ncbi:HTH-type transcriptional regulator GadW [compost metagenome]
MATSLLPEERALTTLHTIALTVATQGNGVACTRDPAPDPQQCPKLDAQFDSRHDVLDQIRLHLASNLREARDLNSVARQLHRSERTLRRHLQQLNTSFQRLLDEVRYDKARQLLIQTDLPIYLIAEQLGYSETASFRHAFQRWSGQPPSLYRR